MVWFRCVVYVERVAMAMHQIHLLEALVHPPIIPCLRCLQLAAQHLPTYLLLGVCQEPLEEAFQSHPLDLVEFIDMPRILRLQYFQQLTHLLGKVLVQALYQ